jgi:ABC-type sulfate transport system permease subunit
MANLIAQLARSLIVFHFHRLFHLASQSNQIRLTIGILQATPRTLPFVARSIMNIQQQRLQFRLEANVIMGATQPPLLPELIKRDPANGASLLI